MKAFSQSHLIAYLSLGWLALAAFFVFTEHNGDPWPWTFILVVSAYVHGVAWGYLWRARGKLTWL